MLLLFVALLAPVWAQEEPAAETSTDPVAEETGAVGEDLPERAPYPELTDAASGVELVHAAVSRMRRGDYEGTRLLLDRAVERDPAVATEVAYQHANVLALERRYDEARTAFAGIGAAANHRTDDARFRVAELTGVLGDPSAALDGLDALKPWGRFDAADRAKIVLTRGVFTLQAGRANRARRQLTRALRKTEPGTVSYYEAKAWAALARERLARADAVPFEGEQRALRKRLRERQQLILAAEAAVRQTIQLDEPEWILDGLLYLAASFERFGDDLRATPDPDGLTADQLRIYRTELDKEVDPVWMRALVYLDEGVSMADRLRHTGRRVDEIRSQRDRVRAKVGGL